MERIGKKFSRWDLEAHKTSKGTAFSLLHQKLLFLEQQRFKKYLVNEPGHGKDFEARLDEWLAQVADEADQRIMAELASLLSFIGESEIGALCLSAFNGPIARWVIELSGLNYLGNDFQRRFREERGSKTRYIGATDSFPLHDFYKIVDVDSHGEKPNLKSFWKTGTLKQLATTFKSDATVQRVVILEDFVGTGEQTCAMICEWVTRLKKPTLFCPLIVCPEGAATFNNACKKYKNLTFLPVLEVTEEDLIKADKAEPAGSFSGKVKDLALALYAQVEGDKTADPPPYTPFGFPEPHGTGCSLVLRGNVPDNALPLIHHKSSSWKPLFPRKPRIIS